MRIALGIVIAVVAGLLAACGDTETVTETETVAVTVTVAADAAATAQVDSATTASEAVGTTESEDVASSDASPATSESVSSVEATQGSDDSPAVEDEVVVVKSGFAPGQIIGIGLVLENRSDRAALGVQVSVNMVDSDGLILGTENDTVNQIPARSAFYVGFGASTPEGAKVASLEPTVEVQEWSDDDPTVPETSNLRAVDNYGSTSVHGQVKNTLEETTLSQFAKISVVVFDNQSNVIGGGFAYLEGDLSPGRSAAFEASIGVMEIPLARIDKLAASMDVGAL